MPYQWHSNDDMDELIGEEIASIIEISKHTHITWDRLMYYLRRQVKLQGGLSLDEE